MFWKKITLDGYIPFTHVGNHHVEIEFDSPASAIMGSNGSGKSSLLRIMDGCTPPVRTDFLKDGSIEMVLTHGGHIFTLTSDFKKKDAPHSFKKDGVELNTSGTSDIQRDLSLEHFGITSMINDLMGGNIKVCDLQRAHRKNLFSSMYPGDLSFILEYHKKVCTQIRAFANQIKLLQSREGSLTSMLLDDAERKRMTEWSSTAQDIVTRIDKINILIEQELVQLRHYSVLKDYDLSYLDTFEQDFNKLILKYKNQLLDYNSGRKYGDIITKESIHDLCSKMKHEMEFLGEKKASLLSDLEVMRDELDKFIKIRDTPTSDKKDTLIEELKFLKKEEERLRSDENYVEYTLIHKDRMPYLQDVIKSIENLIVTIHPYAGRLIGQDDINRLRAENESLRFTVQSLTTEQNTIDVQLSQCRSRKDMLTQNSYPKDCVRVCGLRATLEASVRDIDLRCKELEVRSKQIKDELAKHAETLTKNSKILQEISPILPVMKTLWLKLSENQLTDIALAGEEYLDCLNNHCSEIVNRLVHGFNSAQIYYEHKSIVDRINVVSSTLDMIEVNDKAQISEQVLTEIISRKQSQLEFGINELESICSQYRKTEHDCSDVSVMEQNLLDIDSSIEKVEKALNAAIVLNRIEFDEKILREHGDIRNTVCSKLREIEHTLSEQKRITDVLETEIRPTLKDLKEKKKEWETVEQGLNPNSGLPCIYLIRFINRLIARVNAIIADVWYSEMELAYLDEHETLDFNLKVIFNKNTSAKDISLCSAAQRTLIDIAFVLAIATERGFIDWLPIRLDESDAPFTEEHRAKLIDMLSRMIENQTIKQLLIVSHFAAQSGIPRCSNIVLSTEGIVVPAVYNLNVHIS